MAQCLIQGEKYFSRPLDDQSVVWSMTFGCSSRAQVFSGLKKPAISIALENYTCAAKAGGVSCLLQ